VLFKNREKDKIFQLLLKLAETNKEAGRIFFEYKIRTPEDLNVFSKKLKSYEVCGQELVIEVSKQLDMSLITPIEREDILHLAERIDSILNWLDECAARFEMYDICPATDEMVMFTEYISKCCDEIYDCVVLLTGKKFSSMNYQISKINGYAHACDMLGRKAIKSLFTIYKDNPIKIIQEKELYEALQRTMERCGRVSGVLGTIILKNA
jgi:predicted phosphate transport protein (TIGR00153 family)